MSLLFLLGKQRLVKAFLGAGLKDQLERKEVGCISEHTLVEIPHIFVQQVVLLKEPQNFVEWLEVFDPGLTGQREGLDHHVLFFATDVGL